MGAVHFESNNSFIKRPITHDYTDPSSSLGVSDKDLCTNSQMVIYGEISVFNAGYNISEMKKDISKRKTPFFCILKGL